MHQTLYNDSIPISTEHLSVLWQPEYSQDAHVFTTSNGVVLVTKQRVGNSSITKLLCPLIKNISTTEIWDQLIQMVQF